MRQYGRNYQRRSPQPSRDSARPADIYQQVTDRIIADLETGTLPWRRPWRTAGGMPRSMSTGRRYQGANVMLLAMTAADRGYTSNSWSARRQVNEQGGWIRKGQNRENGQGATYITQWREYVPRDADADGAEDDPVEAVAWKRPADVGLLTGRRNWPGGWDAGLLDDVQEGVAVVGLPACSVRASSLVSACKSGGCSDR